MKIKTSLNRRNFTRGGLAMAVSGALTSTASGWATQPSRANKFKQAKALHPWLMGYDTASQDSFHAQATIQGAWPKELVGTFYRNGPARHEIGNFRYSHWFDGDGMLQAYRMSDNGVSHSAKFVQTYKYQAEKREGRAMYPGFASVPDNPSPVTSPDSTNVGNISVLHHHGKLLALWEAGSPWEMDEDTLDTKGIFSFAPQTKGVPFSAHPRVEPDGTLWNFGYLSNAKLLVLWHIDAKGKLVKVDKINVDPMGMPHDFIVTSKHLVIMVPPFHYESNSGPTFMDAHSWNPDLPCRVLVVDKNDFQNHFWVELPSQWVFHYGNGWEDEAGIIRFDAARASSPSVMTEVFRKVMQGDIAPSAASAHHQYRIDTKRKTISEAPMFSPTIHSEFPSVDPRISCRRNNLLVMLTRDTEQPALHSNLNEIATFAFDSGRLNTFRYPEHQLPEEHVFVPKPGSKPESEGWIVGTALDWKSQQTLMTVFDVRAVEDGPVATATLPYALPLGLHGKFVHA
ncbi:MAG: carotenoid oxygenase [Gammaproteobacteria bacterium]|nr:carotenoid oxygenase [Gammaproteobacteria bacterium]